MASKIMSFFGKVGREIGRAFSMEPLFNTGGHNGGSQSFYNPRNGGPNGNLTAGFSRIRAYSRDITRKVPEIDDGYDTRCANIIGTGIRAIPMYNDDKVRRQIKAAWDEWTENADFDGGNLAAMDRLILRESDESGEVFIRSINLPARYGLAVPIQFQVIESEMLDHTYNIQLANGGRIIAGKEFNKFGKCVAYYFFKNNPEDRILVSANERIRVSADEICHFYRRLRGGQLRGIPRSYSGQMQMRDLMIYDENELERKKNISSTYGFITSPSGAILGELGKKSTFSKGTNDSEDVSPDSTDPNIIMKGRIVHLYPGEEFKETKAADTDPGFEIYVKGKNRSNARGMGMSYASYTGDLSDNSYSGIRAGQNQEETKYRVEQEYFISRVKEWMWQKWFDTAFIAGVFKLPSYTERRNEYQAVAWQAQGWKYINPLQEIQALEKEISLGIISLSQAAALRGRDYEEIVEQIGKEKTLREKAGI